MIQFGSASDTSIFSKAGVLLYCNPSVRSFWIVACEDKKNVDIFGEQSGTAPMTRRLSTMWQRDLMQRFVSFFCSDEQLMADLPKEKVTPNEPLYTNVVIDFFGHFEIKHGRSIITRYGVIFTCYLHTLNTDSCINAMSRFTARRCDMRSDNGTSLVRAERELRGAVQSLNNEQIQAAGYKMGFTWLFHPPTGSHHGGICESQICAVRHILNALLHQQILDEGLAKLLCEAESLTTDQSQKHLMTRWIWNLQPSFTDNPNLHLL